MQAGFVISHRSRFPYAVRRSAVLALCLLTGGRGRNSYAAGPGRDAINARNGRRERIDCGPGRDKARVDRSDRVRRCERVSRR